MKGEDMAAKGPFGFYGWCGNGHISCPCSGGVRRMEKSQTHYTQFPNRNKAINLLTHSFLVPRNPVHSMSCSFETTYLHLSHQRCSPRLVCSIKIPFEEDQPQWQTESGGGHRKNDLEQELRSLSSLYLLSLVNTYWRELFVSCAKYRGHCNARTLVSRPGTQV